MRTPDEIEAERVEVLKKINEKREQLNVISIQRHEKKDELFKAKRVVTDLEHEISTLTEAIRLGKETMSRLKTEAEILQSEYWRARG